MTPRALFFALLLAMPVAPRAAADEEPAIVRAIQDFAAASVEAREDRLAPLAATCREAFYGQDWDAVRRSLEALGLEPNAEREGSNEEHHTVVLLRDVAIGSNALHSDLLLELNLYDARDTPNTELPPTIRVGETTVGLHFDALHAPDLQPFADSLPERSRIREALSSWAIESTRTTYPILAAIGIEVTRVAELGKGDAYPAYVLRFTFTESEKESTRGAHLRCTSDVTASIGSQRIDPASWRRSEFVPPSALETLAADLRALLANRELSDHELLMRATRLSHRVTRNRDWAEVETALRRGGLTLLPAPGAERHTYLIADDAREAAPGIAMDFVVDFRTRKRLSSADPTRTIVAFAAAGFEIEVKQPFEAILKSGTFAPDSAIGKAIRAAEDRDGARSTPILDAISIRYRNLSNRRQLENPRGFVISLEFSDAEPIPIRTAGISMEIASGLEPRGSLDFDVLEQDFRSTDTLGPSTLRGSHAGERTPAPSAKEFTLWRNGVPRAPRPRPVPDVLETLHAMCRGDLRTAKPSTRRIDTVGATLFDDDLAELADLPKLESIDLGSSPGIGDPGLAHLAELLALRELDLSGERITGTGFTHLRSLSNLATLRLHHSSALSDDGMRALSTLKSLRTIQLHWCQSLTDSQLEPLIALPALEELHLWGSEHLTDHGLEILSAIEPLQVLTISHSTAIGSTGIEALANLPNLQELTIGYTPLDEAAIRSIAGISSLEYLHLIGVPLTPKGLRSLLTLASLKCLSIRDGSGLEPKDLEALTTESASEFTLER